MHFDLEVGSVTVHANIGGPRLTESPTPRTIRFDVYPSGREHLDLETGETFTHPTYRKLRGSQDKVSTQLISASLAVMKARNEQDFAANAMHYHEAFHSKHAPEDSADSSISFSVFVSAAEFDELLTNLRYGLIPEVISVSPAWKLTDKVLTYGWEPDGSGTKWANAEKANQRIAIEGIAFHYEVRKQEVDEDTNELVIVSRNRRDTTLTTIAERVGAIEARAKLIAQLLIILIVAMLAAMLLPTFNLR
jgi:hypothetical protein